MNNTEALKELKSELWKAMHDKGKDCPCCGRFAKLYKRPLNKTQVSGMYWLKDNGGLDEYVHVAKLAPAWLVRSNQHTILKHWGLVEQRKNHSPSLSDSGWWKITDVGRRFLSGKPVHKYALLFNDRCFGFREPLITCTEIVDYFNYEQIMGRV